MKAKPFISNSENFIFSKQETRNSQQFIHGDSVQFSKTPKPSPSRISVQELTLSAERNAAVGSGGGISGGVGGANSPKRGSPEARPVVARRLQSGGGFGVVEDGHCH